MHKNCTFCNIYNDFFYDIANIDHEPDIAVNQMLEFDVKYQFDISYIKLQLFFF